MARAPGGRRGTAALLGAAAASLAIAALGAFAWLARPEPVALVILAAGAVAGAAALVALHLRLRRLYDGLDRVRGDLAGVIAHRVPAGPAPTQGMDADAVRLAELAAEAGATLAGADTRRDSRLAAVVASLAEAVVVATESGQVSLVSGAAKALLGAGRGAVGTSLYAALDRAEAAAAAAQARRAGAPIEATLALVEGGTLEARVADLGDHNGTVYSFGAAAAGARAVIDHDLTLHDRAPAPVAAGGATPLEALPVLVLDLETTGLDVERDRVVSIGAVCAAGTTVFRADTLDVLVDPGRPIPARSTAIHGITDVMVAGAPRFAEAWPALAAMIRDRVVVGHNIAFDLAVLRAEAARADLAWDEPPALDLVRLAAALEPREGDLSLDGTAERWGVSVIGRHTALGDALVAAEMWARAVPRLGEQGVITLADAHAFEARARQVIARQRASGW
jgi:DNA polymerase-3 subunit epsilon